NNALAKTNNQTALFAERINNLSVVLDRASQSGENFRRQNEAILSRRSGGAGIISRQVRNVFENPTAFTLDEITGAARTLNTALGDSRNTRELSAGLIGARQAQERLPAIL